MSASRAQEALPVSVELGDVSLTKLPFIVAADAGIYERNRLKVSQFISPRAAELIRQSAGVVVPKEFIHTGHSDINIGGGSPTIVRMTTDARAPQRIILATTEDILRFHIITRGDITRVEDLKGKRIGFSSIGALSHLGFMQIWRRRWAGTPKADLSMFANGAGPAELKASKIDAYAADVIAFDEAKKAGLYDLVDLATYKFPMPGSGINADVDWLPTHRDTAARFVKATIEAVALRKLTRKPPSRRWRSGMASPTASARNRSTRKSQGCRAKPYPSVAGLQKMIEIYDWREMRRHKPEDFFDASFVTELDKSGYIDGLYANAKN